MAQGRCSVGVGSGGGGGEGGKLCSSFLRNFVMPVKELMASRKQEATKIYHIPDWNVQITTINPKKIRIRIRISFKINNSVGGQKAVFC